jgi:hypothetical protein
MYGRLRNKCVQDLNLEKIFKYIKRKNVIDVSSGNLPSKRQLLNICLAASKESTQKNIFSYLLRNIYPLVPNTMHLTLLNNLATANNYSGMRKMIECYEIKPDFTTLTNLLNTQHIDYRALNLLVKSQMIFNFNETQKQMLAKIIVEKTSGNKKTQPIKLLWRTLFNDSLNAHLVKYHIICCAIKENNLLALDLALNECAMDMDFFLLYGSQYLTPYEILLNMYQTNPLTHIKKMIQLVKKSGKALETNDLNRYNL